MIRVNAEKLRRTVEVTFTALGLTREDAAIVADALVQADLWGVSSHGVSNYIESIYVPGLEGGRINARPRFEVVRESSVSAVVDGGGGMGHVVGRRAMEMAIDKALSHGIGVVAARGSRHYGMAGYYSMLALEHDLIGVSLTNADVLVMPTHGRKPRVGTNPISVAVPAATEPPFLLDMATSAVPLGKVLLHRRAGEPMPLGWAADRGGVPTTDAAVAADAFRLMPLGSSHELGSHKGYSLGVLVDVLAGLLSGAGVSMDEGLGHQVGHFFAALRIDLLRSPKVFKEEMDSMLRRLRETPSLGDEPVIYAGFKEYCAEQDRLREGIPLHRQVLDYLRDLCARLEVHCEV
ncbi:MAG: Ldh family oxidoreductase [Acidobacteriota bacterium]